MSVSMQLDAENASLVKSANALNADIAYLNVLPIPRLANFKVEHLYMGPPPFMKGSPSVEATTVLFLKLDDPKYPHLDYYLNRTLQDITLFGLEYVEANEPQ